MIWVIDCNDGASLSNFDESVGREARLRRTREAIEYESWTSTISSLLVSAEAQGDCFECSRTSGQTSDLCIASWQITQILWLCGPMILPENGLSSKELLSRVSQF